MQNDHWLHPKSQKRIGNKMPLMRAYISLIKTSGSELPAQNSGLPAPRSVHAEGTSILPAPYSMLLALCPMLSAICSRRKSNQ